MIKVVLCTDYPFISSLIANSLAGQPDIEIVDCPLKADLFTTVHEHEPDVVLISGHFSTKTGLSLVKSLGEFQNLSVLILGLEEHKEEILLYFEAGASGYVRKDASVEELIAVIRSAYQGTAQISPEIARILIERVYTLSAEFNALDTTIFEDVTLTKREMEVLELLGKGMSNAEIAGQLHIEEGTVKNHVHSILGKLGVNTRREAVRYLAILKSKK